MCLVCVANAFYLGSWINLAFWACSIRLVGLVTLGCLLGSVCLGSLTCLVSLVSLACVLFVLR